MFTNRATLLAAAAALLTAACAPAAAPVSTGPTPAAAPSSTAAIFAQAMADAAMYSPENVLPLFPVVPDANGNVQVVTLTTWNPAPGPQPLQRESWVTVVPEVRDSCNSWQDEDVMMRLRQLLGLRPEDTKTTFVEMTVPADSMFRPTVDPSINTPWPCPEDQRAGGTCGLTFPAGVDTTHITWMAKQMLASWTVPNGYPGEGAPPGQAGLGYPWTRLGYTYNWHPGAPRYGASEYLVRRGTPIVVTSVSSVAAYCGRG